MSISESATEQGAATSQAGSRRGPRLHTCSVELEVPFHDVDALRVVWHGHYYKYLEIARTELFRSVELDVPDLLAMGHGFVVIESGCRHISPLCYGDRMRVTAFFQDITHRLNIGYEIGNLTRDTRAARAHTVLVTTTTERGMLHRTPDEIVERIRRVAGDEGGDGVATMRDKEGMHGEEGRHR